MIMMMMMKQSCFHLIMLEEMKETYGVIHQLYSIYRQEKFVCSRHFSTPFEFLMFTISIILM